MNGEISVSICRGTVNMTTIRVVQVVGPNRCLHRTSRTIYHGCSQPQDDPTFRRYLLRLFRLGLGESSCYRDQYWVPEELRNVGLVKRGWIIN